jgi:CO/xanthine dehydrogenase Mo-binding subunit
MQEKVRNAGAAGHETLIGTRPVRPDGVDKVTGRARFGADYNLPGQLVGRVPISVS